MIPGVARLTVRVALCFAGWCLVLMAGVSMAEERVALVIGNARYPSAPLRNPIHDASAIAERLRGLGFAVDLKADVTQRDMTRAISHFGRQLKNGSVGLFYYAGHGMQVKGRNFLIPVDADITTEASVRSEAVDLDLLLEQLGPARLSVVILDACRNNPFEGKFRSASGSGLAQVDAPKGTIIAYATAPGKVASDGEGSHGVYTSALLAALDAPGLKVEEVFKHVRINVARATASLQVPWESSSLTGDFFFRPGQTGDQRRQADLQKALEEESAKREREAAVLRAELESLRAQITMLKTPPKDAIAAVAPPMAPASKSEPAPTKEQANLALKANVASASGTAAKGSTEWDNARALLSKSRGTLTLSKALAILLGVESKEGIDYLLAAERTIKAWPYYSAFALGVNPSGGMPWGRSYGQRTRLFAEEDALRVCEQVHGPGTCVVVAVDGELHEDKLVEISRRLGKTEMSVVRKRFLEKGPK